MPNIFPIVDGDQATITIKGEYQGSILMNVLHFQAHVIGASIPTGKEEIVNLINLAAVSPGSAGQLMLAQQVDTYNKEEVKGQVVFPIRWPYVIQTLNVPGGRAEPGAPSNVDAVLTKRSSTVGRGTSGSLHLGAIALSDLEGAFISAALQAAVQAAGVVMSNDISMITSGAFWRPIVGLKHSVTGPENHLINTVAHREARVMVKRTAFRGI